MIVRFDFAMNLRGYDRNMLYYVINQFEICGLGFRV